jgi:hypothetical protein
MLQACDVGFCVEEDGRRAPHVGCCMQHGRNIVTTWSQHGGGGRRLLMLNVARNVLATCSQHFLVGL